MNCKPDAQTRKETKASPIQLGLILSLGVLIISFGAIFVRLTQSPSLTVAAWRLTFASLTIAPWALRRRTQLNLREIGLCALVGIFLALHFAFWIESLHHTTVASSVVLVSTNPVFVGLLSPFFKERIIRTVWLGIAISVGGAVLIGWGDFETGRMALFGDLLALGGAVMMSCYLLMGRHIQKRVPLWPYVGIAYFAAAGMLLITAWASGAPLFSLPPTDWLWISLLAFGPQALGHTSVIWALRHLSPGTVAVALLGEPVGASFWAWLIFAERVGPMQGLGCLLVLAGIAYTIKKEGILR